VDRSDVIFCPFHSYVTFAVNLVTESVDKYHGNRYLSNWQQCNFTGSESFTDVTDMLEVKLVNIGGYMKYLRKMPYMKQLLHEDTNIDGSKVLVALMMSIRCFKQLLKDTILDGDTNDVGGHHNDTNVSMNNTDLDFSTYLEEGDTIGDVRHHNDTDFSKNDTDIDLPTYLSEVSDTNQDCDLSNQEMMRQPLLGEPEHNVTCSNASVCSVNDNNSIDEEGSKLNAEQQSDEQQNGEDVEAWKNAF